jgi:hypothetical protein
MATIQIPRSVMLFGGGGGGSGQPFLLAAAVFAGTLAGGLVARWYTKTPDIQLDMNKVGDMITVTARDRNYRIEDRVFKTEGLKCLATQGFPTQYAGYVHKAELHVTATGKTAEEFQKACEYCNVRTEAVYRYPHPIRSGYAVQEKILEWSRCPVSELK